MIVLAVEWIWGEALLDESGRDLFTIAGFVLTFVGFAITLVQLRKTQSAAKAAEKAAERALDESRLAYHKFTVAIAHRFIHEAKIHVDNSAWERAMVRLSDLADQINQLVSFDESWSDFVDELATWNTTCHRFHHQEIKRFPKTKWVDFCRRLETNLNRALGPFFAKK